MIRLPLTWAAFADALSPLDPIYGAYDAEEETSLVPVPWFFWWKKCFCFFFLFVPWFVFLVEKRFFVFFSICFLAFFSFGGKNVGLGFFLFVPWFFHTCSGGKEVFSGLLF